MTAAAPSRALVLAALTVALIGAALEVAPGLRGLEQRLRDAVHAHAYPRGPLSDDIVVVLIGEQDLADLPYLSPIDRGWLAALVDVLARKRPSAIALDLVLDRRTETAKDAALRAVIARDDVPAIVGVPPAVDGEDAAATLDWFSGPAPRAHLALLLSADDGVARYVAHVDGAPPIAVALAMAARPALAPPPTAPIRLAYSRAADGGPRFPSYPASAAAFLPDDWIEGRAVVIGVDIAGRDRHLPPVAPTAGVAGVFLHAQAAQQLLDGRALTETWRIAHPALALAFFAAGAAAVAAPLRVGGRAALALAVAAVALLAPAVLLRLAELRAPVAGPPVAALAGAAVVGVGRWRDEARRRRALRDAFARYVAPGVVDRIARNPDLVTLGGERREITLVFTDLAGFTSLCERADPQLLCRWLNGYLDGMSRTLIEHGATLDKYVGDAVIAFFGAPEARPDHAAAAIAAAMALDEFATAYAARAAAEGLPLGLTRIGVHTGEATVGDFGGARFTDYTAIGDAVNLTARLEAANKALGTRVCVSGAAAAAAAGRPSHVRLRPLGPILLRGRTASVDAFAPQRSADAREGCRLDAYDAAFAMVGSDPVAARNALLSLGAETPGDRLVAIQLARLDRGGGPIDPETFRCAS